MKNGKLQVAIVGCGGIANQKHFPSLKSQADKCEMVAFCDIIVERAEKAAKEYGTPMPRYTAITMSCSRTKTSTSSMSAPRTSLTARLPSLHLRQANMSCAKNRWLQPPRTLKR